MKATGRCRLGFADSRITDDDAARTVNFIHSRVVSAFQGSLAELLSLGPVTRLVADLKSQGAVSPDARLYVGDIVKPAHPDGGTKKGADLHLLAPSSQADERVLAGVVEVKSFPRAFDKLRVQLTQHIGRARRNRLVVGGSRGQHYRVAKAGAQPIMIGVTPATWTLSREFRFVTRGKTRRLVTAPLPLIPDPVVEQVGRREWLITLGWSHGALAEAPIPSRSG